MKKIIAMFLALTWIIWMPILCLIIIPFRIAGYMTGQILTLYKEILKDLSPKETKDNE